MEHFIYSCYFNPNVTLFVHNNQAFSLTTGQVTPTSEKNYKGNTNPFGKQEEPLNPLVMALESKATFVARSYALNLAHLKETMKAAILHRGFSFVDILQPCLIYHNTIAFFKKNIDFLQNNKKDDLEEALRLAKEWNYCLDEDKKVAIGTFYQKERAIYSDQFPQIKEPSWKKNKKVDWKKLKTEFI